MNYLVIALVLLYAIMHALKNFLTKKSNDKQIFIWWYEIFAMIFFLPLFVYFLFSEGINALLESLLLLVLVLSTYYTGSFLQNLMREEIYPMFTL